MLANDMRKGQLGTTTDGIKFRIEDNKKGMIRMATVSCVDIYGSTVGLFDEMGSIYVYDIETLIMEDGSSEPIEFTPKQIKQIASIKASLQSIGW